MKDYMDVLKAVLDLGTTALLIVVAAYLANKWAPRFLAAHEAQAKAMGDLASAVKDGQRDQGEILMAVRVLAGKMDEVKSTVQGIAAHGCARAGGCNDGS
jgi:hypothetical protein